MLPDNSYRPPVSPFARPVSGILIDPNEGDLISVQFNPAWLPVILGALKVLTLQTTWVIEGENTLELQQKRAMKLLSQFTRATYNDRPFFQDAEEADDTTLPDYPWYENVEDWVISLFLAITFTPGAAIAYRVTIPKLRLAFRTGNIGTIFKVLIDDLEYLTGDSYAPIEGLIEKIIDVAGFATAHGLGAGPHMLKIQAVATPGRTELAVVRGDIRVEDNAMLFRQTDCGLEISYDGTVWSLIYDPTGCIQGIVDTTIGRDIQNGVLQGGSSQPGPQPAPEPGACRTYHVNLSARDVWLCPSPVNSGDTVRILNATGGWYDGDIASVWNCPDGRDYLLGTCGNNTTTQTGDPINTLPHMSIIGHVVSTYFDPTTAYTVPNGTVNQPLYFQANDAPLSDNQGSVTFDVEVCSAEAVNEWCHDFNWVASRYDWSASQWGADRAGYWLGQGWGYGTGYYCAFGHGIGQGTRITSIENFDSFLPANNRNRVRFMQSATAIQEFSTDSYDTVDGLHHCVFNCNYDVPSNVNVLELFQDQNADAPFGYVARTIVRGAGTDPFANTEDADCT